MSELWTIMQNRYYSTTAYHPFLKKILKDKNRAKISPCSPITLQIALNLSRENRLIVKYRACWCVWSNGRNYGHVVMRKKDRKKDNR